MELQAQLTGRDGQKQPLRVRCQPEAGAGGELRGLLRGLSQLQEQVSALLAPLVEQESGGLAGAGTAAGPRGDVGEEEEEEEEDDEENNTGVKTCVDGPPLKRTKSQHS
ncbi:EKC/KEOPS complex subunit GON7-like [Gopherus evgoodei]|uniref:EKC/KEOPS complex subunit GON7-like n=1 Tax=Gopherus evgoodei TaxID=1825980 RepID=UPI0011D034BF|nr:EKC/KEOPS complex subunit GON7-like [Gopherus evgoodei]